MKRIFITLVNRSINRKGTVLEEIFFNSFQNSTLIRYCFVPRCSVPFWTHPEIIPVGQFFPRWIQSINQA